MSSGSNMLICMYLLYVVKNNVLHRYAFNIHEDRIDKCSSLSPSSRLVASRVAIILQRRYHHHHVYQKGFTKMSSSLGVPIYGYYIIIFLKY